MHVSWRVSLRWSPLNSHLPKRVFSLDFRAWICSCVFFLLIKVFKAREACSCAHTLHTAGPCSSTSAACQQIRAHEDWNSRNDIQTGRNRVTQGCFITRLISSFKVLILSIVTSWKGARGTAGPWPTWGEAGSMLRSRTWRLLPLCADATCLSVSDQLLPLAPPCLCSRGHWRLFRTREIIVLQ